MDSSPPPKKRIVFIDALRGYAILMMLQGHTVGIVLDDALRTDAYPAYRIWHYMTGLTAPTFFFAAGLIFTFLLLRQDDPFDRLRKGWRRGLWLILLGFLLQVNLLDIGRALMGQEPGYNYFNFLGRSHVLQAIGWALILIVGIFHLSRLSRVPFLIWTLILANAAFIFCPFTKTLSGGEGLLAIPELFLSRAKSGFPILPWVGFSLFGCCAGIATVRWRWHEDPRALIGLFLGGALLSHVLSYPMLYSCYRPFTEDPSPWLKLSIGTYYRLGEVLMLTSIMAALCHWARVPRFLLVAGSETLSIYFIHVILLYGGLVGFGLKTWISHEVGGWTAAAIAFGVVFGFVLLALRLERLRTKVPVLRLLR
jgi:uncharacterized membrane protein